MLNKNPKNLNFIFLMTLFSLTSMNVIAMFQGWYLLDLTGRKTTVGISWALLFAPSLLFLPKIDGFLQNYPVKMVALYSELAKIVVAVGSFAVLRLYPSEYIVYGFSLLQGAAVSGFYPMVYLMVKQASTQKNEARFSSVLEVSVQVAVIVSALGAGFLYEKIGYLNLLAVCAVGYSISVICISKLQSSKAAVNPGADSKRDSSYLNFYKKLFFCLNSRKSVQRHLLGLTHLTPQLIVFLFNIPLLLYVSTILKEGPEALGIVDGIYSAAGTVASLALVKLGDRTKGGYFFKGSIFLMSLGLLLFTVLPNSSVIGFYALSGVFAVFSVAGKTSSRTLFLERNSEKYVKEYGSIYQYFNFVCTVVGCILLSQMSELFGINSLFYFLSFIALLYFVASSKFTNS